MWAERARELYALSEGPASARAKQGAPDRKAEADASSAAEAAEARAERGSVEEVLVEPEVTWGVGVVEIALPGVRASEMELSVTEAEVLLRAKGYYLMLAANVDGTSAKLKKGVLTLRLREAART